MTAPTASPQLRRWPRLAADAALIAGLWSIVCALLPGNRVIRFLEDVLNVVGLPVAANLFVGLVLLVLSAALRRGLRIARWAVIGIEGLLALGYLMALASLVFVPELVEDLDAGWPHWLVVLAAAVGLVCTGSLAVAFWLRADAFPARVRRGSARAALSILAGGLLGVFALVFALSWLTPGTLSGVGEHLYWAARHTFGVSLPAGLDAAGHAGAPWLAGLAGLASALVLLVALWVFLRSTRRSALMTPADEVRLRALVVSHGDDDSLSYFATRRDKSVVFAPDGTAAITYRAIGPICLASGDPLGDRRGWPAAIAALEDEARQHGWHVGVLSASTAGAQAYAAAGFHARPMGDEAVLDLTTFSLEGRAMRPVKRAAARVQAAGFVVDVVRHADLSPADLDALAHCAEQWRGEESDRGFSMALNRLGDPTDGRCVAVRVRDVQGDVVALQSYVPWGVRGLSLDVMRRSPEAPNGVNEAMVVALAQHGPEMGIRRVSLNFAMFRSVFTDADKVGAGLGVRLADKVLGFANRYWQLESLYEANAKYLPDWQPRFVCFDQAATLPQIGAAAAVAEGFLPGRAPAPSYDGAVALADPSSGTMRPLADVVRAQDERLLTPVVQPRRVPEQQRVRLDKLAWLRSQGMDGYPASVPRTTSLDDARRLIDEAAEPPVISVTGRVRALRRLGGVTFAVLEERGETLQAVLERDTLSGELWTLWRRGVDVGDHVSLTGVPGRSRRGEPSLLVHAWAMASKCLRPVPDARTGFTNPEARIRQRYLDLMVNKDASEILHARFRAVAAVRQAFTQRGYLEVETPMLQTVHGGATARPFRTHINAYNADLSLRIAPELALKELCVAGMDRIFELNRCFRNEGADATHNPEFTSVEAYAAYGDYTTMRELTRELIIEVATAVHGEPVAVRPDADGAPERHRLDGEWPVITVHDAVSRATGEALTSSTPAAEVAAVAARFGVHVTTSMTSGEMVLELYDALVEKQTTYPTFYTDFPLETSPLTRTHRSDPRLSERWDLVAWGAEIGTAYTELVDPVDQRDRLTQQSLKAAAGDPEAMEINEGFLTALEYAMPPTGGLGIGVDRLVMMLTGASIRQTLAFPFTKPQD